MKTAAIAVLSAIAGAAIAAWWITEHVEFIQAVDARDDDDEEDEPERYVAWKWK